METSSTRQPATDRPTPLYFQHVYTLTGLLPPPFDDTPEALQARNHAAIAKVAALLPVNANEADLAAQRITTRAQAEDVLRLLRQHAGDIGLVMRVNAQYASMVRTSLSVHGRLMRVQALRHKRQAIGAAVNHDAWALHVAKQSMLAVVDPDPGPPNAASSIGSADASPEGAPNASPEGAPNASPEGGPNAASPKRALDPTPIEAPEAHVDQSIASNVSRYGTTSQHAAFETWLSEQPWAQGSTGSVESDLREVVREAMANLRSGGEKLPANGRKSPGRGDYRCHIEGETAST